MVGQFILGWEIAGDLSVIAERWRQARTRGAKGNERTGRGEEHGANVGSREWAPRALAFAERRSVGRCTWSVARRESGGVAGVPYKLIIRFIAEQTVTDPRMERKIGGDIAGIIAPSPEFPPRRPQRATPEIHEMRTAVV